MSRWHRLSFDSWMLFSRAKHNENSYCTSMGCNASRNATEPAAANGASTDSAAHTLSAPSHAQESDGADRALVPAAATAEPASKPVPQSPSLVDGARWLTQ
jgi:hypothetical protein